ncbi:hypothetical protein BDV37DRAFT_256649 [Aspergillus pseudonomiae]|uniref:Uncharacterized protein n=1 Tax=Aspergillus pseudonomiae TaxID=1506151 RepID=A0A5N7D3A4_9EURO|nr:uncharacterized protein BDV37DRAFT_256649 [Aspergillus pseudonomiae]KAE8400886.1 hypothetical protein BDV37DRAFT_256649 [Aspergillus pseudonomiae]
MYLHVYCFPCLALWESFLFFFLFCFLFVFLSFPFLFFWFLVFPPLSLRFFVLKRFDDGM